MGFGIKVDVKVEAPKVELPKVDVAKAVTGVANAVAGAVSDAVGSATAAVTGAVSSATAAVTGAVDAAASSLASVAGAVGDVAVSFTGAIQDLVLEPHLQLDANASWGDTHFEKGPVWIRIELPSSKAKERADVLHLFSASGSFDQQKAMSEYAEAAEHTVDVLFEDAPMNETYFLEIVREDGVSRTLFADVAYGDLRKTRRRF